MINDGGVSRTPRTLMGWTVPDHVTWVESGGYVEITCTLGSSDKASTYTSVQNREWIEEFLTKHAHGDRVEVLPDASEPQPEEQDGGLADRLIAIANAVYGNDTRHVLDAPTGHGLAAVVRALADGPLIQTEWAAAQFRKLAFELEIAE